MVDYKIWVIWWWDEEPSTFEDIKRDCSKMTDTEKESFHILKPYVTPKDIKHIEYIKQPDLDAVIKFCQMRGFTKYVVFDSGFKHVATDGQRVLLGMG